ncbi:MAG: hypothetical protein ACLPX5_00105 [Dissulfurispiraceae bacterium]
MMKITKKILNCIERETVILFRKERESLEGARCTLREKRGKSESS